MSDILNSSSEEMHPAPTLSVDAENLIVKTLIIIDDRMLRVVNVAEIADLAKFDRQVEAEMVDA